MGFVINVGDATAFQVVKMSYEKPLNGISTFEIAIDGADATDRGEFDTEKEVEIFHNGTSDMIGEVHYRSNFQGGGVILRGFGREFELAEDPAPTSGDDRRVFSSTNDHTIIAALVSGSSPAWTADVSNSTSASVDSFRITRSMSRWNAIINLIKQSNKDILVDQENRTIYLYDDLGDASVFNFVEGINVGEVVEEKTKPEAAKVEVYGKGDGAEQIFGSSGSGNPVKKIIDRNVLTTNEANTRAAAELALITNSIINLRFNVTNPNLSINLGDDGELNAPSAGISDETVDVVRITRGLNELGTETLDIEVTDPNHRVASKNQAQTAAEQAENAAMARTGMQGSGNQNLFGSGINAKTGQSLKIGFYISPIMQDDLGNINVSAINVSYDIDPYNGQFGDASFDGTDPQVQNDSDNTEPGLSGTMDDNDDFGEENDSQSGAISITTTTSFATKATFTGVSGSLINCNIIYIDDDDSMTTFWRLQVQSSGTNYPTASGVETVSYGIWSGLGDANNDYVPQSFSIMIPDKVTNATVFVQVKGDSGSEEGNGWIYLQSYGNHKHGFASMNADNHLHANGSYDINAADLDNISIGDDISEAGGVNASSVNLYLDFWNGSAWINKHSILATGVTIDQGVDISDSGTYPDATGWWRVRVEPITANADFAQGTVELVNFMEN